MKPHFLSILALAAAALAAGCKSEAPDPLNQRFSGDYPVVAVATVGMVADVVRQVGGEPVEVVQICGAGVDPHLYKPSRDDVAAIQSAQLVFANGLMLEGKLNDTLLAVGRTKPVVSVAESIDPRRLLAPDDFAGHADPHVWMDVSAWAETVAAVESALAKFDPSHAADYRQRAEAYRARLQRLDQYARDTLATIPESSRVLVTSHDAFNYFGRAYGLQVAGIQGLSTDSEAGVQRINELVDMLVGRKVQAVFVESSVPAKNIQALIEGARAQGHQVRIGGELYSDAMGPAGTYEGTYEGMLDHNITTVTRALGGQAPARGLQGKLGGS